MFWLNEAQLARLERCFSQRHDKPRVDDSHMLSGIIFINFRGLQGCEACAVSRSGCEGAIQLGEIVDLVELMSLNNDGERG
jgi:hypothetical protein